MMRDTPIQDYLDLMLVVESCRHKLKLSRPELGKILGRSASYVQSLEDGERVWTPYLLKRICSLYGLNYVDCKRVVIEERVARYTDRIMVEYNQDYPLRKAIKSFENFTKSKDAKQTMDKFYE